MSDIIGAVADVANTLINQAFAEHNRKRNYYWNEKAADTADQRQRTQYQDLYSPQAQMEQYAAAGLSPSMMMSGGQPAVGGTPQGAQGGINGPYPSAKIIDPLTLAQIANINADTDLKNAEIKNLGAETQLTMANIIKAGLETENYKYRNELLKLDTIWKQVQIDFAKESNPEILKKLQAETEVMLKESAKLTSETKTIDLQNKYTEETFDTKVQQATADLQKTFAEIEFTQSGTKLNEQQIKSLINKITIDYYNSRTQRLSANAQMKHMQDIVEQWSKENGFREDEIKNEKWDIAMRTITSIVGSACNLVSVLKP